MRVISRRWNASPSQVALAWLLSRSAVMLPIPGTSSIEHLEENVAAAGLKIDNYEMQELWHLASSLTRRVRTIRLLVPQNTLFAGARFFSAERRNLTIIVTIVRDCTGGGETDLLFVHPVYQQEPASRPVQNLDRARI